MARIMILFTLLLLSFTGFGQFEIGIKAGISSAELIEDGLNFQEEDYSLQLELLESGYGYHFGLYTRVKIAAFFIEPAFLINSSKVNYNLSEFIEDEITQSIKSESFTNLDIPLLIGIKTGPFRLQGGPVAHIYLDSSSELFDISGYEQRLKSANYGYQVGAGIDIWKLRFDLLYEGNFSKFGDHITIRDTELSFDDSLARFLLTVGFKF